MKISIHTSTRRSGGYAMVLALALSAATLLILSGALGWTSTSSTMTERSNQYFRTVAVAEAATEKVLSKVSIDYRTLGEAGVTANQASYRNMVPTSSESSLVAGYTFNDGKGGGGKTAMDLTSPMQFRVLTGQYLGLYGYATTYRIISNAKQISGNFSITAALRQDIDVATIPLFQFAIFYNLDLEMHPGATMTVSEPVHCNRKLYSEPDGATLTFQSHVTSVIDIILDQKPGDPGNRSGGTVVFNDEHDGGVSSLNLPVGTNNTPNAVREIVKIPPGTESATSDMGKQRYYNKADMIVLVTDAGTVVKSGLVNNFATTIPAAQANIFLDTTVTFVNKRENKTIKTTQLDVNKLRLWSATNTLLRPILPLSEVSLVYISDTRTQTSTTEAGVRVVNGQLLPPKGLTVATPQPLYVQGHYNAPAAALGTANTSGTLPASLIGDAITVLSQGWSDANSGLALSSRPATSTTVNAALLAGIVETTSGSYSGGVENYPRFLENWSGDTFTYNGSMVVMYESITATAPWTGTGGYYNPPTRNWAFDTNFRDPAKLPPGTPSLRAIVRGQWTMIKPNSTNAPAAFY